jgi:hypothetical protein
VTDTSDYTKRRTDLFKLLPEVNQSDTNKGIFNNVFNRFLTKEELKRVAGYAGQGNPNATIKRQIVESTPHRQAFQLQPLLYTKIGTVEHIDSYKDILDESARLGIDIDRLPLWGDALRFNWMPPIDPDKLINYRNYYWYDESDLTSAPQYITIENKCSKAKAKKHQYALTIRQYGNAHSITDINTTQKTFTISGRLIDLFVNGFVFYTKNSTNSSINNRWWTTVSSTYDNIAGTTTITVLQPIMLSTPANGDISLDELQSVFESAQDCACNGGVGWDGAQWDDNQVGSIIWNSTLLSSISSPSAPGSPTIYDIWYDTVNDELKQWNGIIWAVVQNAFSVIVQATTGTHLWDFDSTCVQESNQWIEQNKWVHENEVSNFSFAKQAKMPIIEYCSSLELNKWGYINHQWKYRATPFNPFANVSNKPPLIELIPLTLFTITYVGGVGYQITLDSKYGDMTNIFTQGYVFKYDNFASTNFGSHVTDDSVYKEIVPGQPYQTVITTQTLSTLTVLVNDQLIPSITIKGDSWIDYNVHWVYLGADDTVPVNHQVENLFLPITSPAIVGIDYDYMQGAFSQEFIIKTAGYTGALPLAVGLADVSLVGAGDVRVYIDGIRQYGNYNELDTTLDGLVDGIQFSIVGGLSIFSIVRVEVGEAAQRDLGFGVVPVRTVADDTAFGLDPTQPTNVSLVQYKKLDQVKTELNQYPLFDMYTGTGNPAFQATALFAFNEDSSYPIDPNTGKRIATVSDGREYEFIQFLVEDATERMFAYRDLDLATTFYWYDQLNNVIKIWNMNLWSDKVQTNGYYISTIYSDVAPSFPWIGINGALWYDTKNKILYKRDNTTSSWVQQTNIVFADVDPTCQTIWKHGIHNETYVPNYVDKDRIPTTVGSASGDWEIPNQLFFNAEHENKKYINYSQLLTHFNTIIQAQPPFPGFINKNLFYTIPCNQVNYGLGGVINEYNDSYDTFLSSTFVDNVTPLGVLGFAHDQYENNLTALTELFREKAVSFMVDTSISTILNLTSIVANNIISSYELNDAMALIYGDSNTYNSLSSLGVHNWVQTIPFARLGYKYRPAYIKDKKLGINQVMHHDGHRSQVALEPVAVDAIIRKVINTDDLRAPGEKLGKQSISAPPTTIATFLTAFSTTSIRPGVYWYQSSGAHRTLYRLNIAAYSNSPPPFPVPGGTLWVESDTLPSPTLRIKNGISWLPVTSVGDGIITKAWQEVDINEIAANIILELEMRLYEAAPQLDSLAFDFSQLTPNPSEQNVYDSYLRDAFNNFVQSSQISTPFSNSSTYNPSDAFTWNYKQCIIPLYPASTNLGTESGGTWQDLYQKLYGTPYPHLEPWKLQGFIEKPTWWDTQYLNDDPMTYGNRRWKYKHSTTTGMWENIRIGVIPVGGTAPNGDPGTGLAGQVSITYNYFSVNIELNSVAGYASDELFPPFVSGLSSTPIRSIFYNYNTQIINPGMDFIYGDAGLVEWQWKTSSQYLYDQLSVAYRMQPVRFMHYTFGTEYIVVQGLQVDKRTEKVYSHVDAIFHGDIINNNETYIAAGVNQWYVNFNRYYNYDTNFSNFRQQWVDWHPLLSYQFDSIIDTSSLIAANKNFDITSSDYNVTLKQSLGIEDRWVEALKATVLHMPPSLGRYETEADWTFELRTLSPIARTIEYYDIHRYPFFLDIVTGECALYKYSIVGVDTFNNTFAVAGNETDVFTSGRVFSVTGSTGNNGSWTVLSSSYNSSNNKTIISVTASITNIDVDGYITANYRTLPWNSGTEIYFSSTQNIPSNLVRDEPYYVIMTSSTTFKVAETYAEATAPIPTSIVFTSAGQGQLFVGHVDATFQALGGASTSTFWRHYTIDTRSTKTFVSPSNITGVQNLIDVIDGYIKKLNEQGFVFNYEFTQQDPDTARPVDWQTEIERFVDHIYQLRSLRYKSVDKFDVTVNTVTDKWTFASSWPGWLVGTPVVISTSGSLPDPILPNTPYFLIDDTNGEFRLAATLNDAKNNIAIDITTSGSGSLRAHEYVVDTTLLPSYEINPIRNHIWLQTPVGIISNIITGPYTEVRIQQTIFDQYGRQLSNKDLSVYREDKIGHVVINDKIPNDKMPQLHYVEDPYNYLHAGGAHLILNGYEHVIVFNNYTTNNALVYDPFVGLNTSKFNLDFNRQQITTQRPNVGGYVLLNNQMSRNFEASVVDIQKFYDTFQVDEEIPVTRSSRALLGYEGQKDYLKQININPKSQFLFWRGLIQNKGSVNSITAFIQSRHFIDAKVDEFWAYKISNYGDSREKKYPNLNLFAVDSLNQEVKFEFLRTGEVPDLGFEGIKLTEDTRWFEYPTELASLSKELNLYFDAEVTSIDSTPNFQLVDVWDGELYYYITDVPCDSVAIVAYDPLYVHPIYSTVGGTRLLTSGVDYERINSRVIRFLVDPESWEYTNIKVYTLNPAKTKLNPAKIIDHVAGAVITTIPIWDPARGHHYHNAVHYIDLQSSTDGAEYTSTFNPNELSSNPWNAEEVGTTWLDTSTLGYVPYYDSVIFPNVQDRLNNWGSLSDWGSINVFQWTESTVPPDQYVSSGNSGVPRKTMFKRSRISDTVIPTLASAGYQIVNVGGAHIESDLTGLTASAGYQIVNVGGAKTLSSSTGLSNGATIYTAYITVDGTAYPVSITGSTAQTYTTLLALINTALGGTAIATLSSGNIKITSTSLGSVSTVMIVDTGLFGSLTSYVAINAAVPGTSITYTATVNINGGAPISLSIDGASAQTFTSLLAAINTTLNGAATAILSGGNIKITSTELGPTSSILIADTTLFSSLSGYISVTAPVVGLISNLTSSSATYVNGDVVAFSTTGTLPPELTINTHYYIVNTPVASTNFNVSDTPAGSPIVLKTNVGIGIHSIVPAFKSTDWIRDSLIHESIHPSLLITTLPTIPVSLFADGTEVDVYINGSYAESLLVVAGSINTTVPIVTTDIIEIVKPVHVLTDTDSQFFPDTADEATQLVEFKDGYEYTSVKLYENDQVTTKYYFWVSQKTDRQKNSLSLLEVQQQLETIPTPYLVFQKIRDQEDVPVWPGSGPHITLPNRYTQTIVRNIGGIVNADNRYLLRFVKDFALRTAINDHASEMSLKDTHEEWSMIRREQPSNIPRELWDKITESIVGYKLADSSIRVPSFERQLYDDTNGTQTQYGLGEDQAFVDGDLALATILFYLQNPKNNFYPTDIGAFFDTYSFDTPINIVSAMNAIYSTFPGAHTNRMFFEVLSDAFSTKAQYDGIIKTSMVALHGIKILEVSGLYDDG